MNLKEKTTYQIDFDTQISNKIVGAHHSFLFSFEKENFNKIILNTNKKNDKFSNKKFEFVFVKDFYTECKKCKKFAICNIFHYNQSFVSSDQLYYTTIIFMLMKQIYNCEKCIQILDSDNNFKIYQNIIINLKISEYIK